MAMTMETYQAPTALPPLSCLKCSQCESYLNDPVTLPCLHSTCRACLTDFNAKNYPPPPLPRPEEGEAPPEPQPPTVVCPVCVGTLGLPPPDHPQEPFDNARLHRIIDLVHSTNVVCQNCSEDASEVHCQTCNAFLCQRCWDATHSAPIFASHSSARVAHEEMLALPKCPQHGPNVQEFFCTEEEVGVCQVCLLKGEYQGRPYCESAKVRSDRQAEIEQSMKLCVAQRERLSDATAETNAVMEELGVNLDAQTSAVRENFAAIRKALVAREEATLRALQELKLAKQQVLQGQLAAMKNAVTRIDDGLKSVQLVLNHSNDIELVYQSYILQAAVDAAADVASTAPRTCSECSKTGEPCHHPSVDSALPVVLSNRVPQLVGCYAAVPSVDGVYKSASSVRPVNANAVATSEEQKAALGEVAGASSNPDDYGCVLM